MLVAGPARQDHYVGDLIRYVGDFLNVLNRSPTSQTYRQHIWSPTSVTNIDVTGGLLHKVDQTVRFGLFSVA